MCEVTKQLTKLINTNEQLAIRYARAIKHKDKPRQITKHNDSVTITGTYFRSTHDIIEKNGQQTIKEKGEYQCLGTNNTLTFTCRKLPSHTQRAVREHLSDNDTQPTQPTDITPQPTTQQTTSRQTRTHHQHPKKQTKLVAEIKRKIFK